MKTFNPKYSCASFEWAQCKCPIIKMPLFSGVPEPVWECFWKKRIPNNYCKGNIIFYEGNQPFGMYFLCKGRVKIVKTDSGLHSSIPRVIEAPNLLGDRAFLAKESYLGSGETLEDSCICFLDGPYFEKFFLEIPQVCRSLLQHFASELGRAEEHLLDFGFKTVRGRLAKYIVKKIPAEGTIQMVNFPGTREDLAKILGTSPEVICRILSEFCKKSLISVSGKDVMVKDKTRLERISQL